MGGMDGAMDGTRRRGVAVRLMTVCLMTVCLMAVCVPGSREEHDGDDGGDDGEADGDPERCAHRVDERGPGDAMRSRLRSAPSWLLIVEGGCRRCRSAGAAIGLVRCRGSVRARVLHRGRVAAWPRCCR